jgi:hypothetical protein
MMHKAPRVSLILRVRLMFLIIFGWVGVSLNVCRAAEIACTNWYPASFGAKRANLDDMFPSGRRPTQGTCESVLIAGEIQNGDYEKFAKVVSDNHPFLSNVTLWSPGGSVEEALKIGRLVRKDLLQTHAPFSGLGGRANQGSLEIIQWGEERTSYYHACKGADCYCASSCFLIWAGGASRDGDFIGIHRPSLKSTQFSSLPPLQASSLYRQILKDIGAYLQDMEIPQRYIDAMTDTASNEIRWVTEKEAEVMHEVPSITEWEAASCGRFTKSETDQMMQLANKAIMPSGGFHFSSSQDESLYRTLVQKYATIRTCGNNKITSGRDAIPDVLR